MLLQIFDDGHLSDAKGRKVDFRNTIIIMTSNVGSDLIRKDSRFGFNTASDDAKTAEQQYQRMRDKVTDEMKRIFRPEFLNRIDQSVVFHSLAEDHIRKIVDLELHDVRENLRGKEITLEVTQALLDHLGEDGFDPVFGARPLRRVIQNQVEDRLSDSLLEGEFEEGDTIRLDFTDGEVTAERIASAPPARTSGRGGAGAGPHALARGSASTERRPPSGGLRASRHGRACARRDPGSRMYPVAVPASRAAVLATRRGGPQPSSSHRPASGNPCSPPPREGSRCPCTLCSSPAATNITSSAEPPPETNGSGSPVAGSSRRFTATFTTACVRISAVSPAASSRPNASGARRDASRPRHATTAKSAITASPPSSPSSSPTSANTKSLDRALTP